MKPINLLFPHQLFEDNPLLTNKKIPVLLLEEFLFFNQFNFHKTKLVYHRASMKVYADALRDAGFSLIYEQASGQQNDVREVLKKLHQDNYTHIRILDPVDDWLLRRIKSSCTHLNLSLDVLDSPLFLNTHEELIKGFFAPHKKSFFQTSFYKQQRTQRNILLQENGEPEGGQWTFDVDNRKKYPKGKPVIKTHFVKPDAYWNEAVLYVEQYFPQAQGNLNLNFIFPYTHASAKRWLHTFLRERFTDFGIYEDAMMSKESVLHHSVLTPMLNVGLLTPQYILEETLAFAKTHPIPLNSLEGFIRQILGWREFIRGVYIVKGREERTRNFWNFTKPMPQAFYEGNTGILPVDDIIRKVKQNAYAHHIERLMVLGNIMLLCEINPDAVYRWFMELFIDAYDWVMVPNVYGMSQFADGGIMSTKPYISGSNYILKMSDYPKGEWQDIWDALFWRFLSKHRSVFKSNPRMGMLLNTFDKWSDEKREQTLLRAEQFLAKLHRNGN